MVFHLHTHKYKSIRELQKNEWTVKITINSKQQFCKQRLEFYWEYNAIFEREFLLQEVLRNYSKGKGKMTKIIKLHFPFSGGNNNKLNYYQAVYVHDQNFIYIIM